MLQRLCSAFLKKVLNFNVQPGVTVNHTLMIFFAVRAKDLIIQQATFQITTLKTKYHLLTFKQIRLILDKGVHHCFIRSYPTELQCLYFQFHDNDEVKIYIWFWKTGLNLYTQCITNVDRHWHKPDNTRYQQPFCIQNVMKNISKLIQW